MDVKIENEQQQEEATVSLNPMVMSMLDNASKLTEIIKEADEAVVLDRLDNTVDGTTHIFLYNPQLEAFVITVAKVSEDGITEISTVEMANEFYLNSINIFKGMFHNEEDWIYGALYRWNGILFVINERNNYAPIKELCDDIVTAVRDDSEETIVKFAKSPDGVYYFTFNKETKEVTFKGDGNDFKLFELEDVFTPEELSFTLETFEEDTNVEGFYIQQIMSFVTQVTQKLQIAHMNYQNAEGMMVDDSIEVVDEQK